MTRRRGKKQKNLFGSSAKMHKKGQNTCCPGGWLAKKKGEEIRIQMQCRRVEG
jgi:hypothetical protein